MAPRVVIVDNFDSFTHNLAQLLGGLGADVAVVRNDEGSAAVWASRPRGLVLSPGPGGPAETGCTLQVLLQALGHVPVLGVCLGMQVIADAFGATVRRAREPMHGRATGLEHAGSGLFLGVPDGTPVGRYHSLCVEEATLPPGLVPTARSEGVLMGLRHAALPLEAVQFHPESVLTPDGPRMMANFLRWVRATDSVDRLAAR